MAVDSGPFPAAALESNRSGRLSDTQRRNIRGYDRGIRKSELTWALFLLAFAAIIFFGARSGAPATVRVGVPIACVALAVGLVVWSLLGTDPLTRDLRQGKVESLEGAIGKRRMSENTSSAGSIHFLDVAGKTFKVHAGTYNAAPDAGYVRIYYLPRSRHVVNLEHLPDHLMPEGTTPQDILRTLGPAVRAHDRVQRNEARADLEGMANQIKSQLARNATPPPDADRDSRPLAEAIVGTWHSMMMTVTFSADGMAEATLPGGSRRSGHWSVDAGGRLHADAMGQTGAAQAWVVGDELTITLNGMGFTFNRVADDSA